jgi:geranylgeranyl diphosphate synthase, type I
MRDEGRMPAYEAYYKALEVELREGFASRQGFLYDLLRYHLGWIDQRGQPEDNPMPQHFQPALALIACDALTDDFRPALPVAAAVELVYNFTLVHGEVQAGRIDAQERPSIWWVWGPAQAINAGDGLHALGRAALLRLGQKDIGAERLLRAMETLDRACLTLCEGQYLDLSFQDQLMVTSKDYHEMIERKTGALTGCSAELGALASGADDTICNGFKEMGSKLGMAWQITQDIAELRGKRGDGITPSNILNKKKSLPLIYALENSGASAKRELAGIYMKRVLEPEDVSRIIAVLEEAGARQYSEARARELADQAMATLANKDLTEEQQGKLRHLGQWALEARL